MKNSKSLKLFIVISVLLCTVMILFACTPADIGGGDSVGGDDASTGATITITFMDGEEALKESNQLQDIINYVPEKEGFVFAGWYLDVDLTEEFVGEPTENVNLYAKWNVKTFMVRFINHDGSIIMVNGSPVQYVEYGASAIAPEDPVYEGHSFKGWSVDFSCVKSDLAVRANFGMASQSIILYGEDNVLLSSESVEVGSDITLKYNTLVENAGQSLPAGLALDALCVDPERTIPYQVPSGEHLMPVTDLVLYVKPVIIDIDGLKITPSRSEFLYDLQGVSLQGSLSENSVINYSFEWVDVTDRYEIENKNSLSVEIGCKDVGEYIYELRATATYKDLEPKYASVRTTIIVNPGKLDGMITAEGYQCVYNGLERIPVFTGLLDGDEIAYRKVGVAGYDPDYLVKDAGTYNIETKIARKNYEELELSSVIIKIAPAELKLEVSLDGTEKYVDGKYLLTYGNPAPTINYNIVGFVNGETEAVLQGTKIENNPYYVGAEVNEYELGLQEDCWTSNNYKFVEWQTVILKVNKRTLVVNAENKAVTYGDARPQYTATLEGALERDVDNILGSVKFTCRYNQRDDAGNYVIAVAYENNSYDVTLNNATLKVNPKPITLKPVDAKVTYGDNAPIYTFKAEGMLSGHNVETLGNVKAICSYAYKSNAGSYIISVDTASVTNKNYSVSYGTAKLTVSAKTATLSLGSSEITYYDAYPNTDHFKALLSAEGLVEGDTIEKDLETINAQFTSAYAIGQPVGEYTITINGYSSNNYNLTFRSGVMTVKKADMTIGVKSAEIVYGNAFAPELVYTGLFGDEKEDPSLAFQTIGSISGYDASCGVGGYTLVASGFEAKNYNVSYANGELAIIKRVVTVVVDKKEITYGDQEPEYTYTLKSYLEGKDVFAFGESLETLGTLSIIAESYLGNAGLYNVVASGLSNANYDVKYQNTTLNVKVKDVRVSPVGLNLVYGDQVPTYEFVAEGLVNDEDISVLGTPVAVCAYAYKSNVGNYPITLQAGVLANANYNITLGQATLSVSPKSATLTLNDKEITYYDAYPNNNEFASLLVAEGLVDGDTIAQTLMTDNAKFSSEYAVGSNVGEYLVTVSGYGSSNYDLTVVNGNLIVVKRALTIGLDNTEIVYGNDYAPELIYTGLVGVEATNPELAFENLGEIEGYVVGNNVGVYTVKYANAEATNYEISYTTAQLKVVERALVIRARDYTDNEEYWSANFDEQEKLVVGGEGLYEEDAISGAIKTINSISGAYVASGNELGERFVWVDVLSISKGGENTISNYTITFDIQVAIKTYGILVTVDEAVYDGKAYGINVEQMFEVPMAEIWYSMDNVKFQKEPIEFTQAGSYTLYYQYRVYAEANDYVASVSGEQIFEKIVDADNPAVVNINKRTVTVVVDKKEITYGDQEPEYTYTLKSYLEGKDVFAFGESLETLGTLSIIAESYLGNAGLYNVVASGLSNANYDVKYQNTTLNVKVKDVRVSPVGLNLVYGDQVPTYEFVAEGLVNDEDISVLGTPVAVCAYAYKSNVGNYPITLQAGVLANANYNITLGQATLSVSPKSATLTLNDKEITYYDAYPNNNEFASLLVAEGLVDGDTIAQTLMTDNAKFSSEYAVGSNVGEYLVTVSGYGSSNYDLTVVNGNLIVAKRALTIGIEDDSLVYGELYEAVFTYNGLVGAEKDDPALAISNLVLSGYTEGQGANTYTILGAGAVSTNYEISYSTGTLVISPRMVTLTINPQTITYGDEDPEFTYYFTSYKEGKSVFAYDEDDSALGTLEIVADGYAGNADKYDLIAKGVSSTQNYTLIVNASTYTVNRKALTVSAKSYTITFGDAKPNFESDVEGLVKGETIASLGTQILYNCLFVEDKTAVAGVYEVEPLLSLGNYKITTTKGSLTVNKKAMTLTAKNLNVTFGDNTPELVAVPSVLAYNDTVDTIGSYELTTSYVRGNNVGSYAINLTASSDKYDLAIVNGTITVSQKSVEVAWVGTTANYVYNGVDRSNLISASYVDIYGATIDASVAFKASNSTPNKFQNAGNYTTTASTSDANYKLTGASITLKMDKATYDESTIVYNGGSFTGVYSPDKTLGADYLFENNEEGIYRWKEEGRVPVVKTVTYIACYNADRENYYDVEISVAVELTPAIVSLSSETDSVETLYDITAQIDVNSTNLNPIYTITPTVWWWEDGVAKRAIGASGNYTLTYSNGNSFTPGTYYTAMIFSSDNYALNVETELQAVGYFLKYKSVDVGGTLYTVEDALNTASSGNVIVTTNTSFASQAEVVSRYYNDTAYYTVKSGATLLLPYKANDTTGFQEVGKNGSAEYSAHPTDDGTPTLYLTLTMPKIVTLNVSGTLTVGALTGKSGTAAKQNNVTGNYSEINLFGNIVASNATINVYGYVKGSGKITATGSTQVTENMYLSGWMGGSISAARYIGTKSEYATTFMSGGNYGVSNPKMFSFSQYEIRAIQTTLEFNYGSSLRGVVKIGTGEKKFMGIGVDAQISKAYFNIISSSSSENTGVMRLTKDGDKITKSFANDKVTLTTDGDIKDGYTALDILVMAKTVTLSSEKVLFPIDGRTNIVVNSGSFTQSYKYKMMPGATITVKSGATYNMNGTVVTYKEGFRDIDTYLYPLGRGDAKVIVEGTMNVSGSFGGSVYGVNGGVVSVASGATITGVKSTEGTGSISGSLKISITFTESGSVTRDLELHNASGTASVAKGTTYTYNGTAWA